MSPGGAKRPGREAESSREREDSTSPGGAKRPGREAESSREREDGTSPAGAKSPRRDAESSRERAHATNDSARVLRLTLAYEGTDYHGWQLQPGAPTVQGLVIEACRRILGDPVKVTGASRTDAGVHAMRQVASVTTASAMEASRVGRALNAVLPPAVRVVDARPAPASFDARRSAVAKRYAYLLDRGPVADPFLRRFAWHPPYALDAGAMARSLTAVRGKHDFSAFCAAPGRGRTPTCTVLSARVVERKQRVAIVLSADSFLHHMVRNIVGSVVEIGRGARPAGWLDEILHGRDRTRAGPTAPAHGLTLVRVLYPRG